MVKISEYIYFIESILHSSTSSMEALMNSASVILPSLSLSIISNMALPCPNSHSPIIW